MARLDLVEALKVARAGLSGRLLDNPLTSQFFICPSLPDTPAGMAMRRIIAGRLGSQHPTYGSWIAANGTKAQSRAYHISETAPLEARLQWIDAMIEEFS